MDIDRVYQIVGSAFKRVFGYYVKRPIQRFNVDNRAEKEMQKQMSVPKAAPRHEGTDHLFKSLTQNNPDIRNELNAKQEDLLKRLSSVRVVSKDVEVSEEELREMEEMRERVKSRLPRARYGTELPLHAYTEPQTIPSGRISLLRALDFIAKHHKSPEEFDAKNIADQHNMSEEDVKNILQYFRPFYKEQLGDHEVVENTLFGISKPKFEAITSMLKPKKPIDRQRIEGSEDKSDESDKSKSSK